MKKRNYNICVSVKRKRIFIQYIIDITHIYAWLERVYIMQGKNNLYGKEQYKSGDVGTNSIVPTSRNLNFMKGNELWKFTLRI